MYNQPQTRYEISLPSHPLNQMGEQQQPLYNPMKQEVIDLYYMGIRNPYDDKPSSGGGGGLLGDIIDGAISIPLIILAGGKKKKKKKGNKKSSK